MKTKEEIEDKINSLKIEKAMILDQQRVNKPNKIMTLSTKTMLTVLFIGAAINGAYLNNYKEAFGLMLTIIIVLMTWYFERKGK